MPSLPDIDYEKEKGLEELEEIWQLMFLSGYKHNNCQKNAMKN